MTCPSCGAYVSQEVNVCPHCNTTLIPGQAEKQPSKVWFKGCSACGCGCLLIILLLLAVIGYGGWKIWAELQKQMDPNPLEFDPVQLSEQQRADFRNTLDSIRAAIENKETQLFQLELTEDELNYLIQSVLDEDPKLSQKLLLHIEIVEDWFKCSYSFELNESQYFNGYVGFLLFIEDGHVDFQIKEILIGRYRLDEQVMQQINTNLKNENWDEIMNSFEETESDELSFSIETFKIEENRLLISLRTHPHGRT